MFDFHPINYGASISSAKDFESCHSDLKPGLTILDAHALLSSSPLIYRTTNTVAPFFVIGRPIVLRCNARQRQLGITGNCFPLSTASRSVSILTSEWRSSKGKCDATTDLRTRAVRIVVLETSFHCLTHVSSKLSSPTPPPTSIAFLLMAGKRIRAASKLIHLQSSAITPILCTLFRYLHTHVSYP